LELIDGEVVCGDEKGVAAFQLLRHRRNEPRAFLYYAFDLLELNGTDLRREPIEVRKATLASQPGSRRAEKPRTGAWRTTRPCPSKRSVRSTSPLQRGATSGEEGACREPYTSVRT
jgi:hypothetical protein